jgi:hypothetical protein
MKKKEIKNGVIKMRDLFYENWLKNRKHKNVGVKIALPGEILPHLAREKKWKEIEEEIEKKIEEEKKRKKRRRKAAYEELAESFPEYYQYLEKNRNKKME